MDCATNGPVASATVQLLLGGQGDRAAAFGVTDQHGQVRLRVDAEGTYRLRFARLGYRPVTSAPFHLSGGEDPPQMRVCASAVALSLDTLTITAEPALLSVDPRLEFEGYYDRKTTYGSEGMGVGLFLESEEIMRGSPLRVSDVLRTLPGVRVHGDRAGRQVITFRGHFKLGGRCTPRVFVNGAPIATGADIDELVLPSSLAAIEVYPGLTKPGEFMTSSFCGVIAVWTGYRGPSAAEDRRPAAAAPAAMLVPTHLQVSLELSLSSDVAAPQDFVWAALTISNLSGDSLSLCITGSRYTLRGSHTNRDVVDTAQSAPCMYAVNLGPWSSIAWQEQLALGAAVEAPETVLIQKRLRCRDVRCGDGDTCDFELRSDARPLSLRHAR